MKKIYIAGCGGMLGEAFYELFSNDYQLLCSDIDLNSPWLVHTDIRNYHQYRQNVLDFQPDYLFHLGAHTSLEYCENNPDDAYLTNTLAVEHACAIANELGIPLLYISTAGIFDGSQDTYDDWDKPAPLGIYARSKYLGELAVQSRVAKHYVCRAGWMMGGGPTKDKKFVNKIVSQIKSGQNILYVVDDKLGTPTYTKDFASNVLQLINSNHYGVYNMVCSGFTSRIEVATEIVNYFGLQSDIQIEKVSSDHFAQTYFAPRPSSERLVNTRLRLLHLDTMRHWKEALYEYLGESFS